MIRDDDAHESPAALVAACEAIEDFEECGTSITSPYDPSQPACFWDPDVEVRFEQQPRTKPACCGGGAVRVSPLLRFATATNFGF